MHILESSHIFLKTFLTGAFPGSLVIPYHRNKRGLSILLIKSKHSNAITFPSGHMDFGDLYEDTAKKELWEETGLRDKEDYSLHETPLIHEFTYPQLPIRLRSRQKVYIAACSDLTSPEPQETNIEWVRWVEFSEALKMVSYKELRELLRKAEKYLR